MGRPVDGERVRKAAADSVVARDSEEDAQRVESQLGRRTEGSNLCLRSGNFSILGNRGDVVRRLREGLSCFKGGGSPRAEGRLEVSDDVGDRQEGQSAHSKGRGGIAEGSGRGEGRRFDARENWEERVR